MAKRLVGLKVVVEVQEGMEEDLVTLRGVVTMSLRGSEGDDLTVVHLDPPLCGAVQPGFRLDFQN